MFFKYLTLFLFVETEQSGFLTSFVTSAKAGWRPDSPESYLVLSLQIILPVILLSPPVMIQACFVGVCSDGPELLQQNLIIVASKAFDKASGRRALIHVRCCLLLRGPVSFSVPSSSPRVSMATEQRGGAKKINRWRGRNIVQKMSEPALGLCYSST